MGTDNIYARVDIHRDRFQNRYRSHITHRQTTLSPMVFRAISSCLAIWNTWCVMAQAWQLPPLPLIEELIIKAGASFNALQVTTKLLTAATTRGDQLLSKTSSITTTVGYSGTHWNGDPDPPTRRLGHQPDGSPQLTKPHDHYTVPHAPTSPATRTSTLTPSKSTPSTVVQMRPNGHQNSLAICLDMSRV